MKNILDLMKQVPGLKCLEATKTDEPVRSKAKDHKNFKKYNHFRTSCRHLAYDENGENDK